MNARQCSSMVGPADAVLDLWDRLATPWGPAREVRACQPLLATHTPPAVQADPAVRLVRSDEVDLLFPAAVAMYTEEVGVSPLADGGGARYPAGRRPGRVARARTPASSTVVWSSSANWPSSPGTRRRSRAVGYPDHRGEGLAVTGMAAVVRDALRRVAPTVSLYVNDFNTPARHVYARCGFEQVDTFATVLF